MLAGIELLVVGVAGMDGVQADAALGIFILHRASLAWPPSELSSGTSSAPESDSSGSTTNRPGIHPPELLHAILDVHDTEPAELAVVLLPEDLDVLVGLFSCEVGQLAEELSDESVSVLDPLTLLRAGPGLHCSSRRGWR